MEARTGWSDLPPNLRQEITNIMCPESRSNLSQCSKQCEEDVKSSSSYIDSLSLDLNDDVKISVGHRKNRSDYYYVFVDVSPQKIMKKCISHDSGLLLYENEIESEITAQVYAILFWQRLIVEFADRVRVLRFDGLRVLPWNFEEVETFQRLESIHSCSELYVELLMPKIQSELKIVQIERESNGILSDRMAIFEKIYRAKTLILPRTIFTDYQFNRLTANFIEIPVGAITENCVIEFIRKWMRGDLREDFECLKLEWPLYQMFNPVNVLKDVGAIAISSSTNLIEQTCCNPKRAVITFDTNHNYCYLCLEVFSQ